MVIAFSMMCDMVGVVTAVHTMFECECGAFCGRIVVRSVCVMCAFVSWCLVVT